MRVITLEEHFWTDALTDPLTEANRSALAMPRLGALADDLRDLGERRLADMDAAGIDVQVLSVAPPAAPVLEPGPAARLARAAPAHLAGAVGRRPHRFAGFATLPTPGPASAAAELERTVTGHGSKGAMITVH